MKQTIQAITHSQYAIRLLDAIFGKPLFRAAEVAQHFHQDFNIHLKTTTGLLRQIKDAGVLMELRPGVGRRSALLCFPRLINLAEDRKVF